MISIDYRDKRSIYQQLVDRISALATNGTFEPGSQLPSVRQLSAELSINPNTVQRAYTELEREGILYSVKGRGCFISQDVAQLQHRRRQSLFDEIDVAVGRGLEGGLTGCDVLDQVKKSIDRRERVDCD